MAPFISFVYFFQAIKHFMSTVYQIYFQLFLMGWTDRGQNTYKIPAHNLQIRKCASFYNPPKIMHISVIQFIHGMITLRKSLILHYFINIWNASVVILCNL